MRSLLILAATVLFPLVTMSTTVYDVLPDSISEADIIIAGGGAAGCVVAARLADADPNLSILVVEKGPTSFDVPTIIFPALFLSALMPTSTETIFYQAEKEAQLGDRALVVPSGGTLGGGSAINLMMYSRPQRSDYDSWATEGWSTNDLIPFMKRLETYDGPNTNDLHGTSGPIQISNGTFRAERVEQSFLDAAQKVGYPEVQDLTALDAINAAWRARRYIDTKGRRQDTASRYLRPRLESGKFPNLSVVVNSPVHRVIFTDKRASGIEILPKGSNTTRTINARKLVVVSSGALGTPSILERSGIGRADVLTKAGVPIVAEVPGVGENFQDHHLLLYPYLSDLNTRESVDSVVNGRFNVTELIQNNDPILGWNAQDVQAKIRPTDAEVRSLGPEFEKLWNEEFKTLPDRPLVLLSLIHAFGGDPSLVPQGQYFSISAFTGYPRSRGSIHITGPSISDAPTFRTGFLTDAGDLDLKKHLWTYKKQREIARRMSTYRGELPGFHPAFANDSQAALVQLSDAPSQDVTDIVYTAEDDKLIEQWIRDRVETTWHSMGTSKMAPFEQHGVVDKSLSVYGVQNLKIADLSIPPLNVAANTANTAITIGEKAAQIFIDELGLAGPACG